MSGRLNFSEQFSVVYQSSSHTLGSVAAEAQVMLWAQQWATLANGYFGDGKASACIAEDPGSIPGLGRSPGEGNGNPLQHSCLENPMDGEAW